MKRIKGVSILFFFLLFFSDFCNKYELPTLLFLYKSFHQLTKCLDIYSQNKIIKQFHCPLNVPLWKQMNPYCGHQEN